MTLEDGIDRWPIFALTPTEFERTVADLVRAAGHEVTNWQVEHLDPVEGVDGTFIIDVTVRFRFLGADFVVLFECKRHASPVKREHVQVLNDKLRSTGAHKGVMVARADSRVARWSTPRSTRSPACALSTVPGRTKSVTLHPRLRSRPDATSPTRGNRREAASTTT